MLRIRRRIRSYAFARSAIDSQRHKVRNIIGVPRERIDMVLGDYDGPPQVDITHRRVPVTTLVSFKPALLSTNAKLTAHIPLREGASAASH